MSEEYKRTELLIGKEGMERLAKALLEIDKLCTVITNGEVMISSHDYLSAQFSHESFTTGFLTPVTTNTSVTVYLCTACRQTATFNFFFKYRFSDIYIVVLSC